MGISLFGRRSKPSGERPAPAQAAAPAPPSPDGKERLTANEWAKRLAVNEVAAERAAMRAGRWHDAFTEEEFIEMIRKADV
jgi:hypothetical protein